MEIIRDLRQGLFDVLIGINLLREGLDIPEVSLVAILDADKEGFLRSERSLIQTCGRAARNVNGRVIMYADRTTRITSYNVCYTKLLRVLIHDGVRPFFPVDKISLLVDAAVKTGAALAGVPVKDTIKEVEGGLVCSTPSRTRLWAAQTPQAFRYALICKAHEMALRDGVIGTDDASLVERLGLPVAMVEGDYRNIKITTPEDMLVAEALYAAERGMQR